MLDSSRLGKDCSLLPRVNDCLGIGFCDIAAVEEIWDKVEGIYFPDAFAGFVGVEKTKAVGGRFSWSEKSLHFGELIPVLSACLSICDGEDGCEFLPPLAVCAKAPIFSSKLEIERAESCALRLALVRGLGNCD